jgi:tetratricopeptide (TPR) repeat protein
MDFETQLRSLPADPAAALALLDQLADREDARPAFHLRRAELLELLGRVPEATAAFGRCLGLCTAESPVRALLGLARLAIYGNDLTAALGHVDEALAHAPTHGEALVTALALQRALGGEERLAAFAERHAAAHGRSPELVAALGEEALLAGDGATAVRHLREAAGDSPAGLRGLHLAQALLCSGDVDGAASLASRLFDQQPSAGLGVLVCDLVRGRDTALDLDLAPEQASAALLPWVDALIKTRRPDLLTPFCDHLPAIEPHFPWLIPYVIHSIRRNSAK